MPAVPPGELTATHLYLKMEVIGDDVLILKTKMSMTYQVLLPTILSLAGLVLGIFLGRMGG